MGCGANLAGARCSSGVDADSATRPWSSRARSGSRWKRGELHAIANGARREWPRRGRARAAACARGIGDWMRIGELLANDGVFEGNQFTPPRYVAHMLTADAQGFDAWASSCASDGAFAAHDVAWLEAAGKQRLWIVPSLRPGDPARGRRAAGVGRLGRGDDSRQHHPRDARLAAGVGGRGRRPEEVRAALGGCRVEGNGMPHSQQRHLGFEDLDGLADDPHAIELARR